jgi:LytS/YehU family sensor histidine kinase
MLENLVAYLRASLQRTRAGPTTLGEELTLVRAYLEIQGVRMGARLRWAIEVPDDLRALELPPLILQPLVENAVRHGLEPRPGGGSVAVRARREEGDLVLEVEDTGLGLTGDPTPGIGLSNVRARLAALYPERASLQVRQSGTEGLSVRMTIPLPGAAA